MLLRDEGTTRSVNRRARPFWALCSLVWLSLLQPAAASAPLTGAANAPLPRFRFDAGAPLAAPAEVAADGSVCVGTVDGYVHALAADGSFRWSRSVRGAVTRRPHFAAERWFIVTSSQRVYALKRDGSLSWAFQLFSPVESELVSDAKGTVYFVAADHFLYGLSAHGQLTMRARFHPGMKPEISFAPGEMLRDSEGNSWLSRSDGVLEFRPASGEKSSLLPLTNSALLPPSWSRASRFAVVSARSGLVFGLDPAHVRPSR